MWKLGTKSSRFLPLLLVITYSYSHTHFFCFGFGFDLDVTLHSSNFLNTTLRFLKDSPLDFPSTRPSRYLIHTSFSSSQTPLKFIIYSTSRVHCFSYTHTLQAAVLPSAISSNNFFFSLFLYITSLCRKRVEFLPNK